ncbi:MAG: phosphoglycerate dehydrogenase [Deltaproteobacteria bacterium CG_4_8_14_3_um_filter_51_11]|nr:phosphoglycerate dehydrogenase [bacterium]OIP40167.1 MAG: phosphoglycerate dehydrogenase [Desulfobacteraceae bacterium CG2_30_51_40]PIP47413.1 MAG: phosphoglycerate dehydrogenase [Deltaproteobacteria bacterium CG23_combo_of_CG06-09_8_20_14_all_51_20]PIX18401.1 MAG: phosphoglycerate dehydrogenase [Deltaproteobacteria bacterium CG_4_8_14_3_um_filter_51_11]PIY25448.1 MAG: phosphoglycerate dehydrogenase [Deltaproteobacteria bacterium CG_4_10_14_3_um_filter_51_14]PJB33576.1 MAG: phosphoglycerate
MYKVMIRDSMSPIAREILEATGQIEVVVDNDKSANDPAVLAKLIGEFDGLAVRSGTKVKDPIFKNPGRLKVIGRAGIGVDNIDVPAATEKGIVVMNAPGGNTITTAEHALSMMLSLARHIPQATASIKAGAWEKKKFMGTEIAGKVLGIVGLGHIGRVVASRAQGLEMKVLASDPYVTKEAAASMGVELASLDELLARSDFITLHVPKLEETKNLIRKDTIGMMKKGVRIINCSRGEVVNIDDLNAALSSGKVAGAALDVYPQEPPDFSHPLFANPNAIFTPHLGASTDEAQDKVAEMIAHQMVSFLLDGVISNAVNFPSISMEFIGPMRPYLMLAERLGSMMGQLSRQANHISITYSGAVADFDTRVLTHAVLKGFLSVVTDTPVNYVNAPYRAKVKGIKVEETVTQKTEDYTNLIRVSLPGVKGALSEAWGTIFAKKYQRIIKLGQIYVDAIPEGSMLIIENEDRPGIIGSIGSILAARGVNIGRFHLGRNEGRAICMVNLDTPVDDPGIEEIRKLQGILSVNYIRLD